MRRLISAHLFAGTQAVLLPLPRLRALRQPRREYFEPVPRAEQLRFVAPGASAAAQQALQMRRGQGTHQSEGCLNYRGQGTLKMLSLLLTMLCRGCFIKRRALFGKETLHLSCTFGKRRATRDSTCAA